MNKFVLQRKLSAFKSANRVARRKLNLPKPSILSRATTTASEIAGAYLIWLYALRPIPGDEHIRSELTDIINKFDARFGSKLSATKRYVKRVGDYDEWWTGTQRASVQTKAFTRDINPNLDEFLDSLGPLNGAANLKIPRQVDWDSMIARLSAAGIPTDRYALAKLLMEMYPLSFVFNWVTGALGNLEDLSLQALWRQYRIDYVCRSVKAHRVANESFSDFAQLLLGHSVSATCHYRAYVREYTTSLPVLPLRDHTVPPSLWWMQGAALLLQRLPKLTVAQKATASTL